MEENMETKELLDAELDGAWDGEGMPEPDAQSEAAPEGTEDQGRGEPADRPETFTLKNRDETRRVTRQELIAMAQKGWDYDNVRRERDQLRQYRQAMEQVRAAGEQSRPGMPGADALLQRVRAGARQQDMERFLQAYPTVRAGDIPREVWEQVTRGVPLVSAYAMHENQRLRLQLSAQRQDQLNRARTPGALGRSMGSEMDELDRMWNEEE